MKQTIFTIAMIVAVLSLPMEASAKGNSFGKAVLLKDANGVKIGRVIGMEDVSWPYVLTREGYRTLFRIGSGKVTLFPDDGVGFAETNCMGMAYVSRGVSLGAVFLPTPGCPIRTTLFPTPKDLSILFTTSCLPTKWCEKD